MRDQGIATRSAVLQHAVSLLRNALLEMAYADAWEEWDEAPDAGLWHGVSADGLAAIADGARV